MGGRDMSTGMSNVGIGATEHHAPSSPFGAPMASAFGSSAMPAAPGTTIGGAKEDQDDDGEEGGGDDDDGDDGEAEPAPAPVVAAASAGEGKAADVPIFFRQVAGAGRVPALMDPSAVIFWMHAAGLWPLPLLRPSVLCLLTLPLVLECLCAGAGSQLTTPQPCAGSPGSAR